MTMTQNMTKKQVLLLILCNYSPLVHLASCVCSLIFISGWTWKILAFLGCLYLLPIFIVRLALFLHPLRQQRFKVFSADYFVWWFTFCWQLIYLRFPALEEILRCIPSLYSFWLRLWGSKIGKLVYWTPGTVVLERQFLNIGNHVCFGVGTRLHPHVQVEDEQILAPVTVEDNVIVGGFSLLTAGTVLKANQATKAYLISPPFSVWENNRRISK